MNNIVNFINNIFTNLLGKKDIPTRMPLGAIEKINDGILPIMNTSRLLLKKNEICHYIECAILITEKILRHTVGRSNGFNIRVCKGITYRIGKFEGIPVEEKNEEQTKGILYITNKRIVFLADNNSFDKSHGCLISIEVYNDLLKLQYKNRKIILRLHNPQFAKQILFLIKNRT